MLRRYDIYSTLSKSRITRSNFGWWILGLFLLLCSVGIIYEMFANYLGFDINLFEGRKAYYFDIPMAFLNIFLSVLSLLNPILEIITSFFSTIIRILNPEFSGISVQFAPIFFIGDKWVTILRTLASAAITTLQISLISIAVGFVIAVFMGIVLVRPGHVFGLKPFSQAYVDFFRSTPLLVQLFIIFFGLPSIIQNLGIPALEQFTFSFNVAAIIGLSLNTAAYQAEIIRGGILAIPTGQTEASRALGMTSTQTMRHVILPQALRIIIPPFTNEGINIILNSSLASSISAWELTRAARNLSSFYYLTFEIYMLAAVFYFIMAFSLAKLTKRFEKKYRIPGLGVHHD